MAAYRRAVARPIFSRGCHHVLAPILGEHRLHFSSVPCTGRRSLKFFPCSCERYPSGSCVDAFFKPPLAPSTKGEERTTEKVLSKERRLRPLLIPVTRQRSIREDKVDKTKMNAGERRNKRVLGRGTLLDTPFLQTC